MGDFLDGPDDGGSGESDNLRRARERLAEDSLPISFGMEPREQLPDDDDADEEDEDDDETVGEEGTNGSILAGIGGALSKKSPETFEAPSDKLMASNPYLDVVSRLSPSDLISKFTASANPRVKEAVRTTVLGLIGSLPKLAFETKTVATGAKLASLMFQLQMTGYMFKNAEYRLSLSESLGLGSRSRVGIGPRKSGLLLGGSPEDEDAEEEDDEEAGAIPVEGEVKGKIKVRYDVPAAPTDDDDDAEKERDDSTETPDRPKKGGMEVEVDASAYLSELRSEVSKLRDELSQTRQSKEESIRKDLLLYIRTLPPAQMKELTSTMTPNVLDAMKGLVNAVMAGIGEGQVGPGTVTEQSGEAMAQLCMWQLVVGYNLRELEVREEMRSSLMGSSSNDDGKGEDDGDEGDGLLLEPGTLE